MKFHETEAFKNLNSYSGKNRLNFGLLLLFYLIKYFNPKTILEIGFDEGCSFGVMLEAATSNSQLTGVDIRLDRTLFDSIYNKTHHAFDKNVTLLHMSSLDFTDADNKYDFINIDGNHNMPTVYHDLVNASKLINQSGIIMIDDYAWHGVDTAIDQFLNLGTNFVPFLIDEQCVYFHHNTHCADEFLDFELEKILASFCSLSNTTYKSFFVKKIKCLPAVTSNLDVFSLICKRYDL
jgi:predicted O-methyltransferase YrrM